MSFHELHNILAVLKQNISSVKARGEAIQTLRRLAIRVAFRDIPDREIQDVFKTMYAIVQNEKSTYTKSKDSAKIASANRLNQYAHALRELLCKNLAQLKIKTLRHFISHMLNILSVVNDILLVPIANVYLRIFQAILGEEHHLSHFDQQLWLECVMFCVSKVELFESLSKEGISLHIAPASGARSNRNTQVKTEVALLLSCVSGLLSWSGTNLSWPYLDNHGTLLDRLVDLTTEFARIHPRESSAHISIVSIVNFLLLYAISNHKMYAQELTSLSIRLALGSWQTRSDGLKKSLLDCLLIAVPRLQFLDTEIVDHEQLKSLLNLMVLDYLERPVKDHLRLSDLELHAQQPSISRTSVLTGRETCPSISLGIVDQLTRQSFLSLKVMAFLYPLCDVDVSQVLTPQESCSQESSEGDRLVKRRKLHNIEIVPPLASLMLDADTERSVLGLQIVIIGTEFSLVMLPFDIWRNAIERSMFRESAAIQSWTYLAIATYIAFSERSRPIKNLVSGSIDIHIPTFWALALRNISSPTLSRAACHLASTILENPGIHRQNLDIAQISSTQGMKFVGPALCSDAACRFLVQIFDRMESDNYKQSDVLCKDACTWLTDRWNNTAEDSAACYHASIDDFLSYLLEAEFNSGLAVDHGRASHYFYTDTSGNRSILNQPVAEALLLDKFPESDGASEEGLQTKSHRGSQQHDTMAKYCAVILRALTAGICSAHKRHSVLLPTENGLLHSLSLIILYLQKAHHTNYEQESGQEAILIEMIDKTAQSISTTLGSETFMQRLFRILCTSVFEILSADLTYMSLPIRSAYRNLLESITQNAESIVKGSLSSQMDLEQPADLFEDAENPNLQSYYQFRHLIQSVSNVLLLSSRLTDKITSYYRDESKFHSLFLSSDASLLLHCPFFWKFYECQRKYDALGALDLKSILQFLVQDVLQNYILERSDRLLQFVARLLKATVSSWARIDQDVAVNTEQKVFEWLLKVSISARISSFEARIEVVALCQKILRVNPDHGYEEVPTRLISTRTCLVNLIKDDDFRVAIVAGRACLEIFKNHEFHTHEQIFADIIHTIPPQDMHIEALRLRVYILVIIASSVEAVQARALRYLLEMSRFKLVASLLKQGMTEIARRAGLSKLDLLTIHGRDLIWGWLQGSTLVSFPSFVFGLESDLFFHRFAPELIPQLVSQGNLDQFTDLCAILKCSEENALSKYLGLISVYSTIRRIDGQKFDATNFITRELGSEKFCAILKEHDLVAIAFSCLNDAADAPRLLTKTRWPIKTESLVRSIGSIGMNQVSLARKPWQITLERLLTIYLQLDTGLVHVSESSLLVMTRDLLRTLAKGISIQKEQAIRKLSLLRCLYAGQWVAGYLPLLLLRGLSSILLISEARNLVSISRELLEVICDAVPGVNNRIGYRTIFESAVILIWAVRDAHTDLSTLKNALSQSEYKYTHEDVLGLQDLMVLCDVESSSKSSSRLKTIIRLIHHASDVFSPGEQAYSTEPRRIFIDLISKLMTYEMLQCSDIRSALQALIPATFVPVNTAQATLLSRLDAILFLEGVPHRSSKQVSNHDRMRELDGQQPFLSVVLASLESYKPKIAECAEQALSRSIAMNGLKGKLPKELLACLCRPKYSSTCTMTPARDISEIIPEDTYTLWLVGFSRVLLEHLKDDFYSRWLNLAVLDRLFGLHFICRLAMSTLDHADCSSSKISADVASWLNDCFAQHEQVTKEHIDTSLHILKTIRSSSLRPEQSDIFRDKIDYIMTAKASAWHHRSSEAAMYLHISWTTSSDVIESNSTFVRAVHENLEEPDSIYGIPTEADIYSALRGAEYRNEHQKTLSFYSSIQAADLRRNSEENSAANKNISSSLASLGLDGLNLNLRRSDGNIQESEYRSAWRLGQWTVPYTRYDVGPQQLLYRLLCSVSKASWRGDVESQIHLRDIRLKLYSGLFSKSQQPLHAAILLELEEILDQRDGSIQTRYSFLDTWSKRTTNLYAALSFTEFEPLLAARQVFLDLKRRQGKEDFVLLSNQISLLTTDYKRAVECGGLQAFLSSTIYADQLLSSMNLKQSQETSVRVKAMTSAAMWYLDERTASMKVMQQVIRSPSTGECIDQFFMATNLLETGLRAAEGKLEKADDILQNYLLPAVELMYEEKSSRAGTIHMAFATFCQNQLSIIDSSDDTRRLDQLRGEKLREITELEELLDRSNIHEDRRKLQHQISKAKALYNGDDVEYTKIVATRNMYLTRSIESFLLACACKDEVSAISRCSILWFSNSTDLSANTAFQKHVGNVPSYKFLVILNQLLSRLADSESIFQSTLSSILIRLVEDHPFHALYTMYSVQYAKRSGDMAARSRSKALTKIMQKLATKKILHDLISKVRLLCANYVKLAGVQINKHDFPSKEIPFSCLTNYKAFLSEFATLKLPPLTSTIEARLSCDYSDIPLIIGYEKTFAIAGGVSAPKIIRCRTSDGNLCKELVKGGNDDLRQDVVMQQVFGQVDELFRRNRTTSQRSLKIRTYKVLPLATNAGVLEWVQKTRPLQDFLQPLHEKYNKGEWQYSACRKAIADAAKRSKRYRIETYNTVTQNCKPAMRYAFLELFNDAEDWFQAQLAYTRSTAAISIVGHILGLGDRHLHNILIDTSNGEVVHIDLGIAFEQGRTLPIPELVPFRLTRDLVDGMGYLGTEGVFRRCCEFTLEMMRTEQDGIKSILDILRYDPLYSWTLSPLQKLRKQDRETASSASSRADANEPEMGAEATRALLVVEQKLSSSLSVSAVVNDLIQQARDPENLALIFAGWSAWY